MSPATEGRRDCAADVSAAVAEIGIREWKGKGMAFGINTGFSKKHAGECWGPTVGQE